jgi:hypothetical protein
MEVAEEFIKGASIDDLAHKHLVQPQTIFGHLVKYAKSGHTFPSPERFLSFSHVPPAVREKVLKAFDQHGSETLSPVYSQLNGEVDFNELRVLQLYYVCVRKSKPGGK